MHKEKDTLSGPEVPSRSVGPQRDSGDGFGATVRKNCLCGTAGCGSRQQRFGTAQHCHRYCQGWLQPPLPEHPQSHPGGTGSSARLWLCSPAAHFRDNTIFLLQTPQLPAGRKLWSRWSHLDVAVPKASRGHQDPTGQGWQDRASSRITPVWGIQIPDARCLIYGLINKWGIMPSLSNTFGCVMLSKSHYR